MERPTRRRRPATRDDLTLWQRAMRDVRPLRIRPEAPPPEAPAEPPAAPASSPAPPALPRPRSAPAELADLPKIGGHRAPGLDRRSAEKLKRGRYTIDGRIDLHGMTQDEAHRALIGFVGRAAADGRRCLLVITGKGAPGSDTADSPNRGVLRQAVPRWLNETPIRPHILAFGSAQPRDGGSGALYVLLRRRR